jgi:sugar (pentulose or hexulose) kinase
MGERGPESDPLARGALVGLTLRHGRGHVTRAVMEGTAFQLRRVVEARVQEGRAVAPMGGVACGGAARSPLWIQALADVLRLPLRVPFIVEAAALGAAILGGVAAGALPSTSWSSATSPIRAAHGWTSHRARPRRVERFRGRS